MPQLQTLQELEEYRRDLTARREAQRVAVSVCAGAGCMASGADEVIAAFRRELAAHGLDTDVATRGCGCPGYCERGPVVLLYPREICYLQVKPEDVPEIIARSIVEPGLVERLLYHDTPAASHCTHGERAEAGANGAEGAEGAAIARECEIPFYKHQERTLLSSNSRLDSRSIDDYLAIGGYTALAKALFQMTPDAVLAEVKAANLRGRGGAGFPAGRKWEGSRDAPGSPKYVIVNADEGDPGAFMDRALLEGNPHSILEGLIIGGYTIGANEGYIYVRQEYPLAVENISLAIRRAHDLGFLGKNILGSGFDFEVFVHRGAGAFVCGESTALMTALEGKVGEPRPKYVRSNVRGLWNRPSVLNNVETWANVPLIVNRGADWFGRIGTESSKGTKIFSLVGKINNTGLVEVPMGMTLREIIYDIGGGIPGGKRFKAVQTGGPSGGCIPAELLDLPVGFDELAEAGSMMGSGGMIVMDEETCMVDVARYFIDFLTGESCGKCVPCREGLRQMHRILTDICAGRGKEGDLETLEALSEVAGEASLCALGKSAPNPFLSTLRYFRDEYEAHIRDRRCPALSCKALVSYHIDPKLCTACMICLKSCPTQAIDGRKNTIHIIDPEQCTACGACYEVCPPRFGAVKKSSGEPLPAPIPESERTIVRKSKGKGR
jgi:NADH-quinone oxidoreductase subunit F